MGARKTRAKRAFRHNFAIFGSPCISLINNWMGRMGIHREAFEVGFKGWDWSMGLIQDTWCAGFNPRLASGYIIAMLF